MISERFITEWSAKVGWSTVEQVEQDLLLSRLIIGTSFSLWPLRSGGAHW
jgi:hypothetical protein